MRLSLISETSQYGVSQETVDDELVEGLDLKNPAGVMSAWDQELVPPNFGQAPCDGKPAQADFA
jgi:hypothetical protein